MKTVRATSAGLALMLASVAMVGSAAGQVPAAKPHDHGALPGSAAPGFQGGMDAGMARMMQDMHSPGYTGNVDVDFLSMMIPHHAGAVDMARLVLQHGRDPATRQLAEEIIAGQTIEIESMTRRLAALQRSPLDTKPGDEFPALGGTRGH